MPLLAASSTAAICPAVKVAVVPPWAISALVSVLICLSGAALAWLFSRTHRTAVALEVLFSLDSVKAVMFDEPDHSAKMQDDDNWAKYEREVLFPAVNAIERFATLVNRRWWRIGPTFYSRSLVKRTASQLLVSLWDDHYLQYFVNSRRDTSSSPSTTYQEFELLVEQLRARPLK